MPAVPKKTMEDKWAHNHNEEFICNDENKKNKRKHKHGENAIVVPFCKLTLA